MGNNFSVVVVPKLAMVVVVMICPEFHSLQRKLMFLLSLGEDPI